MNPETILQAQVIDALNRRGHLVFNHTVGTFFTPQGTRLKIGNHGEADIWGVAKGGRAIFIELKIKGRKPRPDQMQFLKVVSEMGAISGWCTSVEEAIQIVEGEADAKPAP